MHVIISRSVQILGAASVPVFESSAEDLDGGACASLRQALQVCKETKNQR